MDILIGLLLALFFGIVPMLIYALVLWWFDRYEKEPLHLLIAAFLWGAIPAIAFSLLAEIVLGLPVEFFVEPAAAELIGAAVVAPVVEELFKGSVLWLGMLATGVTRLLARNAPQITKRVASQPWRRLFAPPFFHELDSPLDGIIYGGLVGFGFAAVENVFYLTGALVEGGVGQVAMLAFLRAFVFGLNHALFTGLTGWGIAVARTSRAWAVKIGAPVLGLGLGILAHIVHNGSVSFGDLGWPCLIAFVSDYGGVFVLLVIIGWATLRERSWIVDHLADEVARGTLSQEDYAVVCSSLKRTLVRAEALLMGDLKRWWELGRYYRLATELAFHKSRLGRFPDEADTLEQVSHLRRQVLALGRRA